MLWRSNVVSFPLWLVLALQYCQSFLRHILALQYCQSCLRQTHSFKALKGAWNTTFVILISSKSCVLSSVISAWGNSPAQHFTARLLVNQKDRYGLDGKSKLSHTHLLTVPHLTTINADGLISPQPPHRNLHSPWKQRWCRCKKARLADRERANLASMLRRWRVLAWRWGGGEKETGK